MIEIISNPELWAAAAAALVGLAGLAVVITKLTPSVADDEYANKALVVAQTIAGWVGVKPKPPVA